MYRLSILDTAGKLSVCLNGQVICQATENRNIKETERLLKAILPETPVIIIHEHIGTDRSPSATTLQQPRLASIQLPHPAS